MKSSDSVTEPSATRGQKVKYIHTFLPPVHSPLGQLGGHSLTVMMLLLAKTAMDHAHQVILSLQGSPYRRAAGLVGNRHCHRRCGRKEESFMILNLLLQDAEGEKVCKRCVCVWRGGDSCPCAKVGLMLHTIARVWVRGILALECSLL